MKQDQDEKFDKFLVRLRIQAAKCKFANVDENLIDQITEKCSSKELRKKILLTGDKITPSNIIMEANSLEAVLRQLGEFRGKGNLMQEINWLEAKKKQKSNGCSRYGLTNHERNDQKCPAITKIYKKCGYKGHFQKQCRTKCDKRKF